MIISLLDGSIWICMGGFHHKIIYDGNVYDRIGACNELSQYCSLYEGHEDQIVHGKYRINNF